MTRKTAVVICPGRGTYNKAELGYLARHHGAQAARIAAFDAYRADKGQETLSELDGAARFSNARHLRGDNAAALIYAASILDFKSIAQSFDIVAATGNSMGWYSSLAAAGALSNTEGLHLVNTMGRLMQDHLIGGQTLYPFVADDWRAAPRAEAALMAQVQQIDARPDHELSLSIHLGGMLVLAGNAAGLSAFEAAVPPRDGRFPMRLPGHAAFHSALQAPVARQAQATLPRNLLSPAPLPMIDGRGEVWWPGEYEAAALYDYTLGTQVLTPYDFTRSVTTAARRFAPDHFIILGPGGTLGGAVAQSLISARWQGMQSKDDFTARQAEDPLVISMGRADQRALAVQPSE